MQPTLIDPSQPTQAEILDLQLGAMKANLASQLAGVIAATVTSYLGPVKQDQASEAAMVISTISINTARDIVDAFRPSKEAASFLSRNKLN